jgi:hypothetical protein
MCSSPGASNIGILLVYRQLQVGYCLGKQACDGDAAHASTNTDDLDATVFIDGPI